MSQALKSIARRVTNMLSRGAIEQANTGSKMQTLQVSLLADEAKADVEHFEPYGFTSCPQAGAEALTMFIDGDRSHGVVVVAADRRYRVQNLQAGEVAVFTDEGDSIVLKRGHLIEINTQTLKINATTKVEMNTPLLQVNDGDVKADAISLKEHKHGNVQSGSSQTGLPV
jgi:phage baseplate assembly protein V